MNNINRLLLHLNNAIKFSNSKYIQEQALAIILLDNLIEVHLYKNLTIKVFVDKTIGNPRKALYRYNDKDLKNSFECLLKYSLKESIITESEKDFISFAHRIRNKIYHTGKYEPEEIELGLILYYVFINRKIREWKSVGLMSFMDAPEYEQIDFGQVIIDDSLKMLSAHEKYFNSSLDNILGNWKLKNSLGKRCKLIILDELKCIDSNIKFIKKTISEDDETNYYSEFIKFWITNYFISEGDADISNLKNLDYILLYYSFLKNYQDSLNCIDDEKEFYSKGKIWLKEHFIKYKCKYPYWVNLEKIKKRAIDLENQSEEKILKNFMDIQSKINNLYEDISQASSALDGYIQFLYDQWRGK